MTTIEGTMGEGESFPEANASRELHLGVPEEFPVDPVSDQVAAAKLQRAAEVKAREKARKAKAEAKKCDLAGTLTSVLMVAGVVVAAVGVALFVTKKLKETRA